MTTTDLPLEIISLIKSYWKPPPPHPIGRPIHPINKIMCNMSGRTLLRNRYRNINRFFKINKKCQYNYPPEDFNDEYDENDHYRHLDYYEERQRVLGHRGGGLADLYNRHNNGDEYLEEYLYYKLKNKNLA